MESGGKGIGLDSSPRMTHQPQFSVIVPTCDRSEELASCLERLSPGAQEGMTLVESDLLAAMKENSVGIFVEGTYEVIVSDDGNRYSAEGVLRQRFPWVRWKQGPRRGPAANRNAGAAVAKGQWLAFTDDDCQVDHEWLHAFRTQARADSQLKVLEGRTYVDRPKQHPLEEAPINECGGNLWSCNFAIKASVFEEVGRFDEVFPYAAMEDMDLHTRLKRMGAHIAFVRQAGVLHPWRKLTDLRRHLRQHLKSQLIYARKHPEYFQEKHWLRTLVRHCRRNVTELIPNMLRWGLLELRYAPIVWMGRAAEVYALWMRTDPDSIKI